MTQNALPASVREFIHCYVWDVAVRRKMENGIGLLLVFAMARLSEEAMTPLFEYYSKETSRKL